MAHLKQPPPDFSEFAPGKSRDQIMAHYGVSNKTAARWRNDSGLNKLPAGWREQPVPADFAELAGTHCNDWVRQHYGISKKILHRWRRETGVPAPQPPQRRAGFLFPPRGKRPIPEDFAQQAASKSQKELREHYSVSWEICRRWYKEAGIPPAPRSVRPEYIPAPADFVEMCAKLYPAALARHYGVSHEKISRWIADTGALPRAYRRPKPQPIKRAKPSPKGRMALPAAPRQAAAPSGQEEEAAQFLRRFYPFVFHCNERGGANLKGKFWRCGNTVLTPEELIERAKRKGWNPSAWMEIAA